MDIRKNVHLQALDGTNQSPLFRRRVIDTNNKAPVDISNSFVDKPANDRSFGNMLATKGGHPAVFDDDYSELDERLVRKQII